MSLQWEGGGIAERFKPQDAIGRRLICEDGIPRMVTGITFSFQYKDRFIINEVDPDSQMGYWIHALSLARQMMGLPLPTQEEKDCASRVWAAIEYEQASDPFKVRYLEALKKAREFKE